MGKQQQLESSKSQVDKILNAQIGDQKEIFVKVLTFSISICENQNTENNSCLMWDMVEYSQKGYETSRKMAFDIDMSKLINETISGKIRKEDLSLDKKYLLFFKIDKQKIITAQNEDSNDLWWRVPVEQIQILNNIVVKKGACYVYESVVNNKKSPNSRSFYSFFIEMSDLINNTVSCIIRSGETALDKKYWLRIYLTIELKKDNQSGKIVKDSNDLKGKDPSTSQEQKGGKDLIKKQKYIARKQPNSSDDSKKQRSQSMHNQQVLDQQRGELNFTHSTSIVEIGQLKENTVGKQSGKDNSDTKGKEVFTSQDDIVGREIPKTKKNRARKQNQVPLAEDSKKQSNLSMENKNVLDKQLERYNLTHATSIFEVVHQKENLNSTTLQNSSELKGKDSQTSQETLSKEVPKTKKNRAKKQQLPAFAEDTKKQCELFTENKNILDQLMERQNFTQASPSIVEVLPQEQTLFANAMKDYIQFTGIESLTAQIEALSGQMPNNNKQIARKLQFPSLENLNKKQNNVGMEKFYIMNSKQDRLNLTQASPVEEDQSIYNTDKLDKLQIKRIRSEYQNNPCKLQQVDYTTKNDFYLIRATMISRLKEMEKWSLVFKHLIQICWKRKTGQELFQDTDMQLFDGQNILIDTKKDLDEAIGQYRLLEAQIGNNMLNFDDKQLQQVLYNLDFHSPQYCNLRNIMQKLDYEEMSQIENAPMLIQSLQQVLVGVSEIAGKLGSLAAIGYMRQ